MELRVKSFITMTEEEKMEYATRWQYHQREVMKAFAAAMEILFEFKIYEEHFQENIKSITDNNELIAGHIVLDVHELFDLEMPYPLEEVYTIFDTLFDVVLMISSTLVDKELGFQVAVKEVEMK